MINIEKKEQCTGCTACFAACNQKAITMETDSEGFLYPVVEAAKCVSCGLCLQVCPVKQPLNGDVNLPIAYSSHNINQEERAKSSSGGIFILLAKKIIAQNGVVFGAKFDADFAVVHHYADSERQLADFIGSKYVQSNLNICFSQVRSLLNQKRVVLFSGTPCQIAGLKSFLNKPYPNLITIDIVCHGVPSPLVWSKYINELKQQYGPISNISFRNKSNGWKKFQFSFQTPDNKTVSQYHWSNLFMIGFLKNLYLRPSCYACPFKQLSRVSDLTLADFWGTDVLYPDNFDDKGVSLLLVHTAQGEKLLSSVSDNLVLQKVDIQNAVAYNKAAYTSVKPAPKRKLFFKKIQRNSFFSLEQIILSESCKSQVVKFIKRVLKR